MAKVEKERRDGKKGGEKKSWWKGMVGGTGAAGSEGEEKRGRDGGTSAA